MKQMKPVLPLIQSLEVTEDIKLTELPATLRKIRRNNRIPKKDTPHCPYTTLIAVEKRGRFNPTFLVAMRYFKAIGLKEVTFKLD